MKIIDENGRLFGKINIIDLLVILFLLSLTPMFYYGYRIYYFKKATLEKAQEQRDEKAIKEAERNKIAEEKSLLSKIKENLDKNK